MYVFYFTFTFITIIIILLVILNKSNTREDFTLNDIKYKEQKIKYPIKEDLYMNFLEDLNDSFKKNIDKINTNKKSPIKQISLCDNKVKIEIQRKALNQAFSKIPSDSKEIFNSPVFDKSPSELDFIDNSKNKCLYKANHISEYTNPMFYLSQNIYFPPRWIFKPYKNIPLPKHTNLKQWTSMYNCCKGNFY
jgi:hypothetical protein